MKDQNMTRQEKFDRSKKVLDRMISGADELATLAFDEALAVCREGDILDLRDDLEDIAGDLRIAHGYLLKARAKAGRIDTGGSNPILRSGGT